MISTILGEELTKDYLIEVNKGNDAGQSLVHKFGFSNKVSATHNHVWNAPTAVSLIWQTVAAQYDVYSSLASDDGAPLGLGSHKVVLECLLADFSTQFETVVLNGVTPVTTVNGPYIRVQKAKIKDVGIYGGSNLGDIRIEVTSGGAKTGDLQGYIETAEGTTQKTQYTVPLGYTAFLQYVSMTLDSNKTTKIELHKREDADVIITPFGADVLVHQWDGLTAPTEEPFIANHIFPEKTDIWFDAEIDAGSNSIMEIDYSILLVLNTLLP